jgi:hypothetical protein
LVRGDDVDFRDCRGLNTCSFHLKIIDTYWQQSKQC